MILFESHAHILTYGILSYTCTYLGEKSLSLQYNIGTPLHLNYMCSCKIWHYYSVCMMIVRYQTTNGYSIHPNQNITPLL